MTPRSRFDRSILWFYIASTALICVGVCIPHLLPFVDYPQHVGLGDIGRRVMLGDPAIKQIYQLNLFTYNGLFEMAVALLAMIFPVEIASKIMVIGALSLNAWGVWELFAALRRPRVYALLNIPFLMSFATAFGFINFTWGQGFLTLGAAFVVKLVRTHRAQDFVWLLVIAQICAFTHVLATILLCVFAFGLAIETSIRVHQTHRFWLRSAFVACAQVLAAMIPAVVWCIEVFVTQYRWAPQTYHDPKEGSGPSIIARLLYWIHACFGMYSDYSDEALGYFVVLTILTILVVHAFFRRQPRSAPEACQRPIPAYFTLFLATVLYFTVPAVAVGTLFVQPRLAPILVLMVLLNLPEIPPSRVLVTTSATIAMAGGLNAIAHFSMFAWESNDTYRAISEAPEGRRLASVIFDRQTMGWHLDVYAHIAGYYGAFRHGDFAFSFARYLSWSVIYRGGGPPAWPIRGWDFSGEDYNPKCNYARFYDLVLVREKPTVLEERLVRQHVFHTDIWLPKLIAHEGDSWVFDTKGFPSDGTL